ncbi:MAG: AtpZ/AtpI family protein [Bacillota bacterium]
MAAQGPPRKDTFWRDVGLYSTLGLNLAAMVGAGFYIGWRLDRHYGTAPRWILAGFLIGLALGLYTMFSMAARLGGKPPKPQGP